MGFVGSLEVEQTFLVCVSEAAWQHADVEMWKFVRRARSLHPLFHVHLVQGLELVFRGTGGAARLVVPATYR